MSIFTPLMMVSKFVGDAAGLEKTLRFLQNAAQIAAAYAYTSAEAARWMGARRQIAAGRRYLRILKFTDAFAFAFEACGDKTSGLRGYLECGKWSCLGCYLLIESCTMLDTMGIYPLSWAAPLFAEAMKFWFCALVMSLALSLLQLWELEFGPVGASFEKSSATKNGDVEAESERQAERRVLIRKLIVDGADIFIPGTFTGWLATSFTGVGWVGVLSTLVSGWDVWVKIQRG